MKKHQILNMSVKLLQMVPLTGFLLVTSSVTAVAPPGCYVTTQYANCVSKGQVLGGTCTLQSCVPYIPTQCGCAIATSDCIVGTAVHSPSDCGNTKYSTTKQCTVGVVTHQFLGCAYQPPWTTQNGTSTVTCNVAEAGGGDPCNWAGCYVAGTDKGENSTVASR